MKSLKRTLIASAVCFVVCLALLVGTTFAWFTKNLVSPENYITMGKLDFTAKVASSDEGASAYTVTANEDLTFNFAEFEDFEDGESLITENNFAPGASGAKIISITNTGTLAEDVRIFVASNELSTLNNYVWFDLVKLTATQSGYEIAQGYTFEKKTLSEFETLLNSDSIQSRLEVGGVANYMLVYGVNLVDGNELADLTWQSYIYIQAKQANSAAQYGEVKLTTAQALSAAFATGGNYVLSEDVVIKPDTSDDSEIMTNDGLCAQLTVTADTTLDLNGKTIALDESIADISLTGTPCLISVENGATLTIEGDGAIDGEGGVNAEAGYNNSYGINVNGGTLIINSGEFYGAMSAVQVQTGELIINGGFFDLATTIKAVAPQYSKYLINCIDRYYQSGEAKISVYGGTFVNFDPSNSPEGADESYVADGCSVESEIQENGDTWYTVNDDRIPVNTVEGFTEALANGGYIVLDDDVTIDADAAYIKVTGDTVIDLNGNTLTTNDNISYRAENITIKNGTVEMNTALSSGGIPPLNFEGAKNVTLENIVVNGNGRAAGEIIGLSAAGVEDCNWTLKNVTAIQSIDESGNITYGRVTIYNQSSILSGTTAADNCTVTIEDCTFGHIWLTGINLTVSINNLSALGSVSYAISVRSSDNNHNISISGTLTLDSNMTAVFNGYRTGYLAAIASLTVSGDTYSSIDESKWTANLSDENVTLTKNDDGDYVYTKQTSD